METLNLARLVEGKIGITVNFVKRRAMSGEFNLANFRNLDYLILSAEDLVQGDVLANSAELKYALRNQGLVLIKIHKAVSWEEMQSKLPSVYEFFALKDFEVVQLERDSSGSILVLRYGGFNYSDRSLDLFGNPFKLRLIEGMERFFNRNSWVRDLVKRVMGR